MPVDDPVFSGDQVRHDVRIKSGLNKENFIRDACKTTRYTGPNLFAIPAADDSGRGGIIPGFDDR